ncbi:MAG TPA: carboxypeptidase regulatory-like domain-containing protein [Pirellulales bacterium]|nr:carboxypeptidase regulatory-like domain-containing protein [Pirellulales bacterium]
MLSARRTYVGVAARIFSLAAVGWFAAQSAALADTPPDNSDEKPTTKNARSISGILIDTAGFPVSNARFFVPQVNNWRGPQSNIDGKFTVPKIPDVATVLIAWSQRASRIALIPIDTTRSADTQYLVDCDEGHAEVHVIDRNGLLVKDVVVTFRVAGPNGIVYEWKSRKSDVNGRITAWNLPAAAGWTVSASLPSGETTEPVAITAPGTMELPDLVQRADAPADSPLASKALHTFSGRAVDENGQPISGLVLDLSHQELMVMELGKVVTDADGHWSMRLPSDLQSIDLRFYHPEFIGSDFDLNQGVPSLESMRDGTAVQVMKRGLRISGTVRDKAGNAIGNALVLAGHYYSTDPNSEPIENFSSARTERDGKFSIGGIPAGQQKLLVQAVQFAPLMVPMTVTPDTKPIGIMLDEGRSVTGRIVDENGQPLSNITVGVNEWNMPGMHREPLSKLVKTGPDGRFTVSNLPREGELQAGIHPSGRLGMMFAIDPTMNDVGDVTAYSPLTIDGRVIDAQSGEPVKSFEVTPGFWEEERRFSLLNFNPIVHGKDGQFKQTIGNVTVGPGNQNEFVVKITAAGYAAAITPPVKLGDKHEPFVIQLKKATSVSGTVVMAESQPVAQAEVYFVGPEDAAFIEGTRMNPRLTYAPDLHTKTAADGKFELPSAGEAGRILVLHDNGYAIVPTNDFVDGQNIALIPWARIEGTCSLHGLKHANAVVTAAPIRSTASTQSFDRLSFQLITTTDSQGHFVLEHVPHMPLQVAVRAAFGPAATKMIQPRPGQTTTVSLADDGPAVNGKVDLAPAIAVKPPAPGTQFDTSTSWVRAIRVEPKPEPTAGVDVADWEAQIKSVSDFAASDRLTIPTAFADLQPDGSFTFDALAPGKYVLLVEIHGERPPETCGWGLLLAKGHAEFTVSDQPLTLPTLLLMATSRPHAGDPAPQINSATADGQVVQLSDFRGKYVVLDFWAGWCAPCRAIQPALKVTAEKYKPQVAFVGLNFDYTTDKAKQAIESIHSPWTQLLAGPWDANNTTLMAYGVEIIPSLWLIDPEGQVVARDLSPDQLDGVLAKTLPR